RIIALVGDQGALVTVNGGQTWSSWFNQPTAQLFHVSVAPAFPYRVCAAQQESGSVCIASRGNDGQITDRDWHPVGAIEYGYIAPDPLDPDVIYGAGRNEVSKFHRSTGQVQNVTPIPVRGAGALHLPGAERQRGVIYALGVSPRSIDTLWAGTDDGLVWVTADGGAQWSNVTPAALTPWSKVTQIEASHFDADSAYVSVSRM